MITTAWCGDEYLEMLFDEVQLGEVCKIFVESGTKSVITYLTPCSEMINNGNQIHIRKLLEKT